MAVVTFSQWLGGDDKTQLLKAVPSARKILQYNFGVDVTGWTFSTTYQTIVVDSIATDRLTGEPNFANSTMLGAFPETTIAGADEPSVEDALQGLVNLYIPADMYTGAIIPDKQKNIPIVVVGFSWTTATSPAEADNMRWGIIQNWQPLAPEGDPTTEVGYVPLTV
jgi:hypothetical protein